MSGSFYTMLECEASQSEKACSLNLVLLNGSTRQCGLRNTLPGCWPSGHAAFFARPPVAASASPLPSPVTKATASSNQVTVPCFKGWPSGNNFVMCHFAYHLPLSVHVVNQNEFCV